MSQRLTTKETEKSTFSLHMTTGKVLLPVFVFTTSHKCFGIVATILSTFIAYVAIVQLIRMVMVADITKFVRRL